MSRDEEAIASPILAIDDEEQALIVVETILLAEGFERVICCADGDRAMNLIEQERPGIVLLDLVMPGIGGEQILESILSLAPDTAVIVISGINDAATAVACMKKGAFDYLVKPISADALLAAVNRATALLELRRENSLMRESLLKGTPDTHEAFSCMVGAGPAMRAIFRYCEAIARSREGVLITGETGTGKELLAQALHALGRPNRPLVTVNLAGVDENVFSDTLFGHVKGAFTGADSARSGLVESAEDGTLFLDEIGDLAPGAQIRLLRFLQNREYVPLGSDHPQTSHARVIAATHQDLEKLVEEGRFRRDLYYRLLSHHVRIPPLRERPEEIAPLTRHFVEETAQNLNRKPPSLPKELFPLLCSYDFPGNIRELRAMVVDAVGANRSGVLSMSLFRKKIGRHTLPIETERNRSGNGSSPEANDFLANTFPGKLPTLREATEMLIEAALQKANGNQRTAADILGISRQALNKRLTGRNR